MSRSPKSRRPTSVETSGPEETNKPAIRRESTRCRKTLDKAYERFSVIEERLWQQIATIDDIAITRAWIEAAYQLRVIAANRAKLKGAAE